MSKDQSIIVNLSGRGDKDINTIARLEGITL
jgi:Tryptophan synthase beta chain